MQHQHQKQSEPDNFAAVIKKIQSLTASQQKFIQEMLQQGKKAKHISTMKALQKSFGVWADRKDMKDSIAYVEAIRKSWASRVKRVNN
jgi:RNA processing factor Prp31